MMRADYTMQEGKECDEREEEELFDDNDGKESGASMCMIDTDEGTLVYV